MMADYEVLPVYQYSLEWSKDGTKVRVMKRVPDVMAWAPASGWFTSEANAHKVLVQLRAVANENIQTNKNRALQSLFD
ncbi:MAG: hypothetical protein KGL39_39025 [Patescibacteria group bacterium]|nr:hypothetical protein [Patescibacteria group bacterium]